MINLILILIIKHITTYHVRVHSTPLREALQDGFSPRDEIWAQFGPAT